MFGFFGLAYELATT